MADSTHWVYVALDTDGNVGYVGITSRSDPRTRWHEHADEFKAGEKSWPAFVARWQVESEHKTRRSAKQRESKLIAELRPPWNIAENENHTKVRRAERIVSAWRRDPRKRVSKTLGPSEVVRKWDQACAACDLVRKDTAPKLYGNEGRQIADGVWRFKFAPAPGGTTSDVASAWEALAAALHVHRLYVETTDRPDTGYITAVLKDPFPGTTTFDPVTDPDAEIFTVGAYENGDALTFGLPGTEHAHHQLWAGVTGSGKSSGMRVVFAQLALRGNVVLYAVDPKQAEFTLWGDRLNGLVLEEDDFDAFFVSLREEMRARKRWIAERGYNEVAEGWRRGDVDTPPPMVVAKDEFAVITAAGGLRRSIPYLVTERAAQEARGLGIMLMLGTQYPDVGTLPNKARMQFTWRMAMAMQDSTGVGVVLGKSAPGLGASSHLLPLRRGLGYVGIAGTKNYPLVQIANVTPDMARSIAAKTMKWKVRDYGIAEDGSMTSPLLDGRGAVVDTDLIADPASALADLCGYDGDIVDRSSLADALASLDPQSPRLGEARALADATWELIDAS